MKFERNCFAYGTESEHFYRLGTLPILLLQRDRRCSRTRAPGRPHGRFGEKPKNTNRPSRWWYCVSRTRVDDILNCSEFTLRSAGYLVAALPAGVKVVVCAFLRIVRLCFSSANDERYTKIWHVGTIKIMYIGFYVFFFFFRLLH